jgi:hypothetical protein
MGYSTILSYCYIQSKPHPKKQTLRLNDCYFITIIKYGYARIIDV